MAAVISSFTLYCITRFIEEYNGRPFECNRDLVKKFPDINSKTLFSIRGMVDRKLNISNIRHIKTQNNELGSSIMQEIQSNTHLETGVMEKFAKRYNVSPFTISRVVLDSVTNSNKKEATPLLKNTSLIDDKDLSYEVFLSSIVDTFSPLNDYRKHLVGLEHEKRLEEMLKKLDIAFLSEETLRLNNSAKTPDILLELPICVEGFCLSWIESKALFADEATHSNLYADQYKSYCSLYGPGMVIYWSGYVDTVKTKYADKLLVLQEFPENVEKLNVSMLADSVWDWVNAS